MSTLTADRIRNHATKLDLTHLTETITQLVERAEAAQMGCLDFVDPLLEEEVGLREGRRFRNALKLSGLPHHKTLDDFDFAFQPGLDARKVRDLATLESCPPGPTSLCSGRPASAKPCSPSRWPSRPAKPGSPSISPSLDDLMSGGERVMTTGGKSDPIQLQCLPAACCYRNHNRDPRRNLEEPLRPDLKRWGLTGGSSLLRMQNA